MLPELNRRRGWMFLVGGAATAFAEPVIEAAGDPAHVVEGAAGRPTTGPLVNDLLTSALR